MAGRLGRPKPSDDTPAAQERLRAAEATRRAATAEHLPSVSVNADYGAIGLTAASALSTFAITGVVNIPEFDGARRVRTSSRRRPQQPPSRAG